MEAGSEGYRTPGKFAKAHPDQVKKLEEEKGVKLQGLYFEEGLEMWMEHFDFNHDLILDKARPTGFNEELTYGEASKKVFDRYARVKKAYLGSEKYLNGDIDH